MKISSILNKYKKLLILFFWLIIWEAMALIVNRDIFLPTPIATIKVLYEILLQKETYTIIFFSSYRAIIGFLLSSFLGFILGYLCGLYNFMYILFKPLVSVARTIPVMSIIILALFWFDSANVPIFVSFLMCFPIIWTSVVIAIKNTDQSLLQMCTVYKVKGYRILKSIYFYSSLPYLKSAMVSSLGLSWKVTAATEVLSLPKFAIGSKLYDAKIYLDIPSLFSWTIIILILSFIFETLLSSMFKKLSY